MHTSTETSFLPDRIRVQDVIMQPRLCLHCELSTLYNKKNVPDNNRLLALFPKSPNVCTSPEPLSENIAVGGYTSNREDEGNKQLDTRATNATIPRVG